MDIFSYAKFSGLSSLKPEINDSIRKPSQCIARMIQGSLKNRWQYRKRFTWVLSVMLVNMSEQEHKFVKLTVKEIHQLSEILVKRFPKAAQLYNVVQIYLSGEFGEEDEFYRYNGLQIDLTCIVSKLEMPFRTSWKILAPICSDNRIAEVITALSNIIDWKIINSLNAVDNLISEHVRAWCVKYNGLVVFGPGFVYYMPNEDALQLNTSLPPGVHVRPLTPVDLPIVLKHSKYLPEKGTEVITNAVKIGSAGLFLYNELVSWAMDTRDGGIHAVHTLEGHRGQGYAKILMRHLCKTIAQTKGKVPVVHIEAPNTTSVNLMTKVGFKFSHTICWTEFHGPSAYKKLEN